MCFFQKAFCDGYASIGHGGDLRATSMSQYGHQWVDDQGSICHAKQDSCCHGEHRFMHQRRLANLSMQSIVEGRGLSSIS